MRAAWVAAAAVAWAVSAHALEPNEQRVVLPTRPGVTQSALLELPSRPVRGIALLFPGGDGVLGLTEQGITKGLDNFVVRTRRDYARAGVIACLLDVPSDHAAGIWNYRLSANEAADVGVVIDWLRARWSAPVWAVGTSRGTLSAANVAARLGSTGPQRLVLTSSVTAGSHEVLGDVDLSRIRVPVLLIHNRQDACPAAPPSGARELKRLLRGSALSLVSGGLVPESDPCGGLSYHGFFGVEPEVTSRILEFLHPEREL